MLKYLGREVAGSKLEDTCSGMPGMTVEVGLGERTDSGNLWLGCYGQGLSART